MVATINGAQSPSTTLITVHNTANQRSPRYHGCLDQFAFEFDLAPLRRIFTVTELNAAIRATLDSEFQDIWVSGEISGLKLAASGHYYFTLKERDSQVRCVAFRSAHRYWKCKPQDGLAVLARGRMDVYEARGEYQLLVETHRAAGTGRAATGLRAAQEEAGRRRPVRARAEASAAAISAAHRHRDVAARRGHRGHGRRS